MLIEGMAMLLLTIPFVFPIIQGFGYDPVWFGVLMCVLVEFSLISPPVAINLYVVQGVTKVPLHEVARGIVPFITAYLFCLVLLIIFPQISLFLPGTMK
jgi:TRAP-type C4-dicarboxylate transport system permease large subunit